uniref:(northern house mosquito) hypothetical protein n=1 Tax=Culex pipiens TaxID=7175 RepID=A0A8D8JG57_CULPI
MAQATGFASESRSWRENQQLSGINTKPGTIPPLLRRPASRRQQPATVQQLRGVKRVPTAAASARVGVFGRQPSQQWWVRRVTVVRHDHDGERFAVATSAGTVAKLQHVHGRHGALAEWHQQQKRYNR